MSLLEAHNLPFTAALCVMLLLAVGQAVGVVHLLGDHDLDGDHSSADGSGAGLLGLLGIGRIPFLIWLALLLLLFAAIGLGIQALVANLTGGPLDALLATICAGVAALPSTAFLARPLASVLPGDESSAIPLELLVGRRGKISDGTARRGFAARASVTDRHGMTHHVMVEPHDQTGQLHAGDEVLLVRREGNLFFAAALHDRALSPY